MGYTPLDQNHGAVAEYNGDIIYVENNDSLALKTIINDKIPLYSSITFKAIEHEIPNYVNTVKSEEHSIFEEKYNQLVNYVDSKWNKSLTAIQTTEAYERVKQLYNYINNTYLTPETGLPKDIEINTNGLFKSVAWHPHQDILAIASNADCIYLYTKKDSMWTCQVLEHKLMKDIRCIQWKTKATGTLAVGCKSGVCVWTIESHINYNQGIRYHPAASMRYFDYPECVTALAWDPSPGSHLLAVASSASSMLTVQDVLLNRTVCLKRYGKGTTLLRWSYDGKWLFAGGATGISRLWNSDDWTSKQLKNPPGLWVQAACWLPDNTTLLYSMKGKNDIHALCLSGSTFKNGKNIEIWDIKIKSVNAPNTDSNVIRDLCIDSRHGQRLAVIFEDSAFIGIYNVQISPLNLREKNIFTSIGYLRGAKVEYEVDGAVKVTPLKDDAKPLHISFSSSYKYGAVLAVAWDNGTMSFVTHTFKSDRDFNNHFM
ncbi:hypothetical protein G6F57_006071 [Rhizopus arrhizus]|nr:hypothetical protein G6F30_007606 [Rhizopus arrhizus]KAG1420912.1 hypothetical protein G6F58_003980 [Rhizopus delemar]KAG0981375.1 hypothetical protein G6F29_007114 [Rhizopus arrhizus]KAG0993765.1 hypothetical protein G6F28_006375 [Rhizopus arrhizus]KAG1007573.1 hypothetical protein G6F27_007254 [Rhizopus arrhizus]